MLAEPNAQAYGSCRHCGEPVADLDCGSVGARKMLKSTGLLLRPQGWPACNRARCIWRREVRHGCARGSQRQMQPAFHIGAQKVALATMLHIPCLNTEPQARHSVHKPAAA